MAKYCAKTVEGYDIIVEDSTEWGPLKWSVMVLLALSVVVCILLAIAYSDIDVLVETTAICFTAAFMFAVYVSVNGVFERPVYSVRVGSVYDTIFCSTIPKNPNDPSSEHDENIAVCKAIALAEEKIKSYAKSEREARARLMNVSECRRRS